MNYVVFDTETASLNKPFCYNIGYIIVTEAGAIALRRDYVVEQIWHNLPLFSTAYYAEKRPLYISMMKSHKTKMEKFGYICAQMRRDFKNYNVERAFAYNSSFDERVFDFNCDWFKCINPFDELEVADIRGFVHKYLISSDFEKFCENYNLFTENGNYSTTAETMYKFITGRTEFEEAHTALSDSMIENDIFRACIECGATLEENPKALLSVPRHITKTLHIQTTEQTDYYFEYESIRINKDKTEIKLR